MKQVLRKISIIAVAALFVPATLLAQKEEKEKDKEVKEKWTEKLCHALLTDRGEHNKYNC